MILASLDVSIDANFSGYFRVVASVPDGLESNLNFDGETFKIIAACCTLRVLYQSYWPPKPLTNLTWLSVNIIPSTSANPNP